MEQRHWQPRQVLLKYRSGFCWSEAGLGHAFFRLAKADIISRATVGIEEASVLIGQESERCGEAPGFTFPRIRHLGEKGAKLEGPSRALFL